MRAALERGTERSVLTVEGAVDASRSADLRRALLRALAEPAGAVVVDVRRLRSIDAAAAGLLAAGTRHADAVGGSLVIRGPQPAVLRALRQLPRADLLTIEG